MLRLPIGVSGVLPLRIWQTLIDKPPGSGGNTWILRQVNLRRHGRRHPLFGQQAQRSLDAFYLPLSLNRVA